MLIDIKQINYIIFEKIFQFCCAKIKIIEFIYDNNNKHSDIVKIIKIVE